MSAQNIYDDPEFLAGYSTLGRQVRGLAGAAEWPVMRAMLPELAGRRVVDLGCGFGWFSRWADENGAASVTGVDVSAQMLERARTDTTSTSIDYVRADLDELELETDSADLVFSSLTLHYVHDLGRLLSAITTALVPGGSLVFSVEHPIYSASVSQKFELTEDGRSVWPLENYLVEGERVTNWFVDGVIKQHRTVATYVNTLISAGLVLDQIEEWGASAVTTDETDAPAEELHRPWFLLISATKSERVESR